MTPSVRSGTIRPRGAGRAAPVPVRDDGRDLQASAYPHISGAPYLKETVDVPLFVWLITIAGILALLVFDFYSHVRTPHVPHIRESAFWSAFYIGLAILFGIGILVFGGGQAGGEYFAGWLTEKALSVDNLFVFLIIMSSFAVPKEFQQKVLLVGVAIALVARGVFIALGVTIIENFSWVFYLFGALLFWLAWSQARSGNDHGNEGDSRLIRILKRFIPTSDHYDGDRLTTRVDGKRLFTPMLLVMVAIGLTATEDEDADTEQDREADVEHRPERGFLDVRDVRGAHVREEVEHQQREDACDGEEPDEEWDVLGFPSGRWAQPGGGYAEA